MDIVRRNDNPLDVMIVEVNCHRNYHMILAPRRVCCFVWSHGSLTSASDLETNIKTNGKVKSSIIRLPVD